MLKVLSDSELRRVYEELLSRKDGSASVPQKGSASVPHCCDSDDVSATRICMVCGAQYDSQGACPECNNMSVLHRLGGPLDIKVLCLVTELNGWPCLEYSMSVLGSVFRFSVGFPLDAQGVPVSFETTDELFEFTHNELSDGPFVHYLLRASGLFDCDCAYDSYEYNKFHSEGVDCDA